MAKREEQIGSQMRITPQERALLESVFKGNEELLRVLRKIFLPELDPYVPIGQNLDLWMTLPLEEMTPEAALINIKARNSVIAHLESCLRTIKILAESPDETPEEALQRLKKDSSK